MGNGGRFRATLVATLVLTMAMALTPMSAAGGIGTPGDHWYVDVGSGSDTTGVGSEGNPWQTIGHALSNSDAEDVVWVEPGTYDTTYETFPLSVPPGVALKSTGGMTDTEIDAEHTGRVFQMDNPTTYSEINGFEITGGSDVDGSAVYIDLSSPIAAQGWPRIIDNFFVNNGGLSTAWGGAILMVGNVNAWVAPHVEGNAFLVNNANRGGAVYGMQCAPTFADNDFGYNEASGSGGAIHLWDGFDATFDGDMFYDNESTGGGAIYAWAETVDSTLTVTDADIEDNTVTSGDGGGIEAGGPTLVMGLERSRLSMNSTSGDAGGLAFDYGVLHVSDTYFGFNQCFDTGGMGTIANGADATLVNVTAYGHTSTHNFKGLYVEAGAATDVEVHNSIFWGQSSEDMEGVDLVANSITQESNLASDNTTEGANVTHASPDLYNGGDGQYRVFVGSPAIDAGDQARASSFDVDGEARSQDGDGNGSAVVDIGCWERPTIEAERHAGTDRFSTACLGVRSSFDSADTVIIASGENFPDALSASGLAGAANAPLLLTFKDSIPSVVLNTISALGATEAYIVGGEGAVSAAVKTTLEGRGLTVTRLAGTNRYATSAAVCDEIEYLVGANLAFFARGDNYPDALAVGPMAFSEAAAVLLVDPNSLPTEIRNVMNSVGIEEGYICGGTGAVSSTVKEAIDTVLTNNGGSASTRWSGSNRYATAAAIARGGVNAGMASWEYIGLATGANYPDALSGGAICGNAGGVLLLTDPATLPAETQGLITSKQAAVLYAEVFGGNGAVSPAVLAAFETACGW